MKINAASELLAALAHETRLGVFRYLVVAGTEGAAAGDIAAKLKIAAPTLSFHLRHLEQCGLVRGERQGRNIFYAVDYERMRSLLAFLMEDCCKGRPEMCAIEIKACCA